MDGATAKNKDPTVSVVLAGELWAQPECSMVGVPRSTGCQNCIKRHIKCDRTRPECAQCQKHGVQCAGYARARKFMDEGPVLRRKFGQSQTRRALPVSIDELVAPSLVSKSMTSQQPTVFHSFILTAFPCFFGLNKHRVHVPWTTHVADQLGTSATLDAAVYCINWAFMGRARGDATLQKSSWEMYSTALGSIRGMFNANAAYAHAHAIQSRNTLAAAMVLCMFEAYARTARDRDAWTKHASGAGVLMSLRGPARHLSGFDRCLYLSFRSFLVAQAFIQGSPCLFERPEWQALIDQIRAEDMRDPRVDGPLSTLVELSDRLFGEIVRIPGYVARARLLHLAPAQDLTSCVAECYHTVRMLDSDLRLAVAMRGYDSDLFGSGKPFIGPIPSRFPHDFAGGLLRATESSLRILRLLLSHLDSTEYRVPGRATSSALVSPGLSASAPPAGLPFRIISKSHIDESDVQPGLLPVEKWLDQVASSMGMDALEVIADDLR